MADGFYSFLGFPRLIGSVVVKKAIAKGIQDDFFRYYSGSTPILGGDGKYQVPLARVRFNTPVSEDEIDGPMQIRDNSGIPSTGPDCHSIWTCYP